MSDVFLARQPILDSKQSVEAYELLYRHGDVERALVDDDELATARVALGALTEIGLDRVVGQQRAWINVTREFLLQGLAHSLPPERVVLELLEDQLVDEPLLELISELRDAGYVLALDDYSYTPGLERLLGIVEFVKLDLLALASCRHCSKPATTDVFSSMPRIAALWSERRLKHNSPLSAVRSTSHATSAPDGRWTVGCGKQHINRHGPRSQNAGPLLPRLPWDRGMGTRSPSKPTVLLVARRRGATTFRHRPAYPE